MRQAGTERRAARISNAKPQTVSNTNTTNQAIRLVVPKVLAISDIDNRRALLKFLGLLRRSFALVYANYRKSIVLDFSHTYKAFAPGMLLFYAEIARMKDIYPSVSIRIGAIKLYKIGSVLDQIGLLSLCNCERKYPSNLDDVVHWQKAEGDLVDNHLCGEPLSQYENRMSAETFDQVLLGLAEAQTNAIHHAYITPRMDNIEIQDQKKKWWMFSQEREGLLTVLICDLGAGISNTLPLSRGESFKAWVSNLTNSTDSRLMDWAIQDSRSRTKMDGRGKGLGQIVDATQLLGGKVRLFSNRGLLTFEPNQKQQTYNFKDSIFGTVVLWQVQIQSA